MARVTMTKTMDVAEKGIHIRRFVEGTTVETTPDAAECIIREGWGYDPDAHALTRLLHPHSRDVEAKPVPGPEETAIDGPDEPDTEDQPRRRGRRPNR